MLLNSVMTCVTHIVRHSIAVATVDILFWAVHICVSELLNESPCSAIGYDES